MSTVFSELSQIQTSVDGLHLACISIRADCPCMQPAVQPPTFEKQKKARGPVLFPTALATNKSLDPGVGPCPRFNFTPAQTLTHPGHSRSEANRLPLHQSDPFSPSRRAKSSLFSTAFPASVLGNIRPSLLYSSSIVPDTLLARRTPTLHLSLPPFQTCKVAFQALRKSDTQRSSTRRASRANKEAPRRGTRPSALPSVEALFKSCQTCPEIEACLHWSRGCPTARYPRHSGALKDDPAVECRS
ncbi:hypothetical protein VTI28DRAFT_6522 [Corynascus sepedonium]